MKRLCEVDGCDHIYLAKGVCRKHYEQMRHHGRILKATPYEPNVINLLDDRAEIVLSTKHGEYVAVAIIDIEDVERVSLYKWFCEKGYPKSERAGYLHRFVMDAQDGVEVDHIIAPLENRKRFLRFATHQQNVQYKRMRSNNTSGFKGVSWAKVNRKWVVQISVDKKQTFIGYFDEKRQAAIAYDNAAMLHYGDFALTNKMLGLL